MIECSGTYGVVVDSARSAHQRHFGAARAEREAAQRTGLGGLQVVVAAAGLVVPVQHAGLAADHLHAALAADRPHRRVEADGALEL